MASLTRAGITASRGIFRLSQCAALYASTLSHESRSLIDKTIKASPINPDFDGRSGDLKNVRRSGPNLAVILDYHLVSLASQHPQDGPLECISSFNSRRRRRHAGGIDQNKVICHIDFGLHRSERFRAFNGDWIQ